VRFADLDGGANDDIGAITLEHRGQVRSLRRRTSNDNSASFEWCPIHPANPVILLKMLDRITRLTELTRCREPYNNARAPRESNRFANSDPRASGSSAGPDKESRRI